MKPTVNSGVSVKNDCVDLESSNHQKVVKYSPTLHDLSNSISHASLNDTIDTRNICDTAIAILASNNIDNSVRGIVGHQKDCHTTYIGKCNSINRMKVIYDKDKLTKEEKENELRDRCWRIFKEMTNKPDPESGLSIAFLPINLLTAALKNTQMIPETEFVNDVMSELDDLIGNEDLAVSWFIFWKIALTIFRGERIFPSSSSHDDLNNTKEKFKSNISSDIVDDASSSTQSTKTVKLPMIGALHGILPSSDIAQVDDVYYKKNIVHDAVSKTVKNESRARRRLRSGQGVFNFSDQNTRSLSNKPHLKYSNSKSIDQRSPYHLHHTVSKQDLDKIDYVPGMYFTEKAPSYALPTEAAKVAELVFSHNSYPVRWNMKKAKYEQRLASIENKQKKKELLREICQLSALADRSSIEKIVENEKKGILNANKQKRDEIYSQANMHIIQQIREEEIARRQYEAEQLRDAIASSLDASVLAREKEKQEYACTRRPPLTRAHNTTSVIKKSSSIHLRGVARVYKEIVLSERMNLHAQLKSESIINSVKSDAIIHVSPLDSVDYFLDIDTGRRFLSNPK